MQEISDLESRRATALQFVKFCLIGLSSTVVDVGIAGTLTYRFNWNWMVAQTVSFCVSVSNGFLWNSLWTFRGAASGRKHVQYLKFVAVNLVGLVLNLVLMKSLFVIMTGHLHQVGNPNRLQWGIAKAVAIVLVSIWNFFANRRWTFAASGGSVA
jgi:putative flippase GtrA